MATIRYRVSNEEVAIFAIHLNLQEESDRKETAVFAAQNLSAGFVGSRHCNNSVMQKCLLSSCVVSYLTLNF